MIVPDYRALLYHGGSGGSGGGSNGGRSGSGSSWREYSGGAQGGRKSRYDLTYGDVIQGLVLVKLGFMHAPGRVYIDVNI